ncbi:MAG: hypothetical protein M1820_008171 [Bogoriella megaspora]|nr:MAG: hypothetical protein M1820_008171 [Bogoriella megaspora]
MHRFWSTHQLSSRGSSTSAAGGILYTIPRTELAVLQDPQLRRGNQHFRPSPWRGLLSLEEAARQLVVSVSQHARSGRRIRESLDDAMDRIEAYLFTFGESTSWEPDIVFKMFNDLDRVFFRGVLYHRVYLRWLNISLDGNIAITDPPLPFVRPRVRITLYLQPMKEEGATLYGVLGHLLHEMLHAYLMTLTHGHDSERGYEYHGPHFQECARAIERRFCNAISVFDLHRDEA